MKIDDLKKKFKKEAIMLSAVLAFLGVIYTAVFMKHSGSEEDYEKITQEINSINGQARTIRTDYENYKLSNKTFSELPEHKRLTDDLDSTAARIRAARPIIEALKERYKFVKLDVTFSPINEDTENASGSKSVIVLNNELSVEFEGMSDELVFSFMDSLSEELPGYLQLTRLRIDRADDINQKLLNKISQERSLYPTVRGNMTFTWKTLKTKPDPNAAKQAQL